MELLLLILAILPLSLPLSLPPTHSYISGLSVTNLSIIPTTTLPPLSPSMNVITGETGSGKSLLTQALALACGQSASVNLLPVPPKTTTQSSTDTEPTSIELTMTLTPEHEAMIADKIRIALPDAPTSPPTGFLAVTRHLKRSGASTLRNICTLNSHPCPLKTLKHIVGPLIAVVDTDAAAAAMSSKVRRMAAVDQGVEKSLRDEAKEKEQLYRGMRSKRIRVEKELQKDLPPSFAADMDETLLLHWVEELENFFERLDKFLVQVVWDEFVIKPDDGAEEFELLQMIKAGLRNFDDLYIAASSARDSLDLSSGISDARDRLFDIGGVDENSKTYESVEKAHEAINRAERAVAEASKAVETGILDKLEDEKPLVSIEQVEEQILEWSTLSRKHGIANPCDMRSSMARLRDELVGDQERKQRLPLALVAEEAARKVFLEVSGRLLAARQAVAEQLSSDVSERMGELGMEGGEFRVDVVNLDTADFFLKNNNADGRQKDEWGKVEEIASSGERARLLLLIETVLPGAVAGATEDGDNSVRPITVLYDEIDSHVGGRAAVAVAKLLSDQGRDANQIISITHNAAIASIADNHFVVDKVEKAGRGEGVIVGVRSVEGEEREREVARMAAGELVDVEGLEFARALLREGQAHREGRKTLLQSN